MRRIIPYILLNILISALTMWVVLMLWQNSHPTVSASLATIEVSRPTPTRVSTLPAASYDDQQVEIVNVIGAGDLNFEVIILKNSGKNAVSLSGWMISDGANFAYTFPALTVYEGGAFQLFSRSGVNSAIELYAGSSTALWKSGSTVVLKDPSGKIRQEYTVP